MYRLSSSAVRRLLLRQSMMTPDSLLYTLLLGFGIGLLGQAPFLPLVIVLAVLSILHIRSFRNLPQWKDEWRDFEVILEPDRVFAWRHGAVECTIGLSEIRKVVEQPIHGLRIHSHDRHKQIWAPSLLTGYKLLRATLAEWTPIERRGSWQLWNYLGLPTGVAIFATTLLVRSRYVFFPLLVFVGFYLLRLARISIKSWSRRSWPAAVAAIEDPLWIPAIPFVMLALLAVKSVWILYK